MSPIRCHDKPAAGELDEAATANWLRRYLAAPDPE